MERHSSRAPVRWSLVVVCMLIVSLTMDWSDAWVMHNVHCGVRVSRRLQGHVLHMGRASVVRAQTKARTDGAKNKLYTHFGKKLLIAIQAGGADPVRNRQLAQVMLDAKAANVPKDIVTRNINKALDRSKSASSSDFKETVYEFYAHGGAGLLVNTLSDNDNRVSQDVSLVAKKHGLRAAAINSVQFKFDRKARIDLNRPMSEEQLMEVCLQSSVDDFQLFAEATGHPCDPEDDDHRVILVDVQDMSALRDSLRALPLTSLPASQSSSSEDWSVMARLVHVPQEPLLLSQEDLQANLAAIDAFEELEDVDCVEHNMFIPLED